MANQWFKFFGAEYLSDSKIGRLSSAERSCWVTLLCMASQTDGVIEFLTVDDLLTKSGIKWNPYDEGDWEKCQSILVKFSQLKMIKVSSDESWIEITNWKKRQENTAQTGYERLKKHRENKAKKENDNEMITDDNANDNVRIEENRIDKNRIEDSTGDAKASAQPNWQSQEWADERSEYYFKSVNETIHKKYFLLEIQKFTNYWTEKNPGGKKERWQMQKVFDPNRRLATWISRFLENKKPDTQSTGINKI